MLRPRRWKISLSSCSSSAPTCFCRFPSSIFFNRLYFNLKQAVRCNNTAKFASKFTDFSMKKFSVILQYLSRYKGKIVVYMIFNILSIVFGLISLGMLSPFLSILFDPAGGAGRPTTLNTNAIGGLKELLTNVIVHYDKSTVLLVICVLIITSTFLKNLFYY